ncbi:MAG TPA: sulfotransferase [Bacteroidales bacterium]|nr:sulfotransferase [Bacteroidales bacterium]
MKDPIIIIGMPRSGASFVSELLHLSGIFMGADRKHNGESQLFTDINHWIFAQAGANWDNPYNMQFINEDFKTKAAKNLKRQLKGKSLRQYLGDERHGYRNYERINFDWGWKDPRSTFTLEMWRMLFEDARIINVYRNPVDSAESLRRYCMEYQQVHLKSFLGGFKRGRLARKLTHQRLYDFSLRALHIEEGYKLWQQYITEANRIQQATGFKVWNVRFENLMQNPQAEIENLFAFLGFKVPDGIYKEMEPRISEKKVYAFLNDKHLCEYYQTIRNQSLVTEMNYHDIG